MISKFIEVGSRVEIQIVKGTENGKADQDTKVYKSEVSDILSEEILEIVMPMEKTKLILLPKDVDLNLYFYTKSGQYQCMACVRDRYKKTNLHFTSLELTSNLRKYQRREYYRFSCALEMNSRIITEEEKKIIESNRLVKSIHDKLEEETLQLRRSVILDISGGGLRFISDHKYEPESLVYCTYNLVINDMPKQYELVGKVLQVKEMDNKKGFYEHRVQYIDVPVTVREEIIKYIFEEERKNRKNDRLR